MKPILLLDVDGVLCPWGDPVADHYRQWWHGENWDWVSDHNGRRLHELLKIYEIVWATARDWEVLETVGPAHNLPPLKVIEFGTLKLPDAPRDTIIIPAHFNGQTWKLPWIDRFAETHRDRPIAWVDDELYPDAYDWMNNRNEDTPTMIIQPDSGEGITDAQFDDLREWGLGHHRLPETSP